MPADASSYGLNVVLHKNEGEQWKSVEYASHRHAKVEKEGLTLMWGGDNCLGFFLIGRHLALETDLRPFVGLLDR